MGVLVEQGISCPGSGREGEAILSGGVDWDKFNSIKHASYWVTQLNILIIAPFRGSQPSIPGFKELRYTFNLRISRRHMTTSQ